MEWDERKNKLNIKNHGISFEEAQEVFNEVVEDYDTFSLEYYDEAHSSAGDERYICIGDIGGMVIVYVAIGGSGVSPVKIEDKDGNTRLISTRKAEPIEERYYYEHIKRAIRGY